MSGREKNVLVVDDNVEFARLVATLLAEQGLRPLVAHTTHDGLSTLRNAPVDVAVIDLLLPETTGHKLIEIARREEILPQFIAMSGVFRGHEQQARIERIAKPEGWYEKPFDTRLMVEQVVNLCGGSVKERGSHRQVGAVTDDFDINIVDPVTHSGAKDDLDLDLDLDIDISVHSQDLDEQPPPEMPESVTPVRATAAAPVGLSDRLRATLARGDLAETTMPHILNAFAVAQETGEVVFERGQERKIVYFLEGKPCNAVSNVDADRLGAFARRAAGLDSEVVDAVVEEAKDGDLRTGDLLLSRQLIDEATHAEMMAEQTRSIIRSLFIWESGRFVVGFKKAPGGPEVRLAEDPVELIITGVRDLFALDRLRRLLPNDLRPRPAPSPPLDLHCLPLTDIEALLLLRATGDLSVAELAELFYPDLNERSTLAQVYSLMVLGVLV